MESICARHRTLIALAIAGALAVVLPISAAAQGALESGTIAGIVADESGAVLPGVTVTIVNLSTSQSRIVVTDAAGHYRVAGLTPSRYSLTAELQGFATLVRPEITVNIGVALDLNLVLKISQMRETVTVTGEAPLVESSKTSLSTVVTREQIETLPSNGRNYLDFALLAPGTVENASTTYQGSYMNIGGGWSFQASLLVDGFYNMDEGFALPRQHYSQESVQEFQVISLGATAEIGRAIGGTVNAITKSGGNDLSGSAFGFFRGKSLNSKTPDEVLLNLPKSEFNRRQWGGVFGGPIRKNRTFFFASVERSTQNSPYNNNITAANAAAIGLPAADSGIIRSYRNILFAMIKLDHSLNENQKLQFSWVRTDMTEHNVDFDTFVARSRPLDCPSVDTALQFKYTAVTGKWFHEVKAAYFPRDYACHGVSQGGPPLVPDGQINTIHDGPLAPPIVNITNVANFGSISLDDQELAKPVQILYSSSVFVNRHSIKFGADVMHVRFGYNLWSPLSSTYTFNSLSDYLAGRYSTYTQGFGSPSNDRTHNYISAFVQDSWTPSNRVTLNYGLRYDLELNPKNRSGIPFGNDYNNLGPRFALSYDLTGRGKTFLKVNSGLFYDRIFLNMSSFFTTLKQDPTVTSVTWRYGQAGAPVYPQVFQALPPGTTLGLRNVWIMPNSVEVPMSLQNMASLDHEITNDLAVSASVLYTRTWHDPYGLDTNLQWSNGGWVRPDPNYRLIRQYQFNGKAEYLGVVLEVKKRTANQRFNFSTNVTFARAYSQSNSYGSTPSDIRYLDQEWGRAPDTPSVRFVANVTYNISKYLQASAVYRARTGYFLDPRAGGGYDLNGDGTYNDRSPGFTRNVFEGPSNNSMDARIVCQLPVHAAKAQVFLEAFNVLNTINVRAVNSTYGPTAGSPLPTFMVPLNYWPPREIQLGVRFEF
jgi:hypothetical protein